MFALVLKVECSRCYETCHVDARVSSDGINLRIDESTMLPENWKWDTYGIDPVCSHCLKEKPAKQKRDY